MMTAKVRARQFVGRLLSMASRETPEPGTLTVLMYHAVTADLQEDAGQMSVSAEQFERHLSEIASSEARVVDLVEGVSALRLGHLGGAAVAIVFDDGFVGVHEHAAPALLRRSWPATAFITSSWIGRAEMPLAGRRLGRPLTWSEVDDLVRSGISIGSHTDVHPRLSALETEQMHAEVARARDTIAARVGRAPDAFAYPFGAFGSFNARTRAVLEGEGVRVACTTVCGRNRRDADPLAIRRIRVSWCDGDGEVLKAIAGCYDWYRWVQRAQTLVAGRAA